MRTIKGNNGPKSREKLQQEYDKYIESLFTDAYTRFVNPVGGREQVQYDRLGQQRSKDMPADMIPRYIQRYKEGETMPKRFGLPDSYEEGLKEYINAAEEKQRQERGSKGNPKLGAYEHMFVR